jgi:hypothetical protein
MRGQYCGARRCILELRAFVVVYLCSFAIPVFTGSREHWGTFCWMHFILKCRREISRGWELSDEFNGIRVTGT